MFKNKSILIILVILAVSLSVYTLSLKENLSFETDIKQSEKINAQKQIKVEEAGISILIPNDFIFSKEVQMNLTTNTPYAVNFSIQNYRNTISEVKEPYQLYVIYQWDTEKMSEEDFKKSDFNFDTKTREEFFVDGYLAISGKAKGDRARYTVYILNKGHLLVLAESKTTEKQREITEAIIKNIKFN